MFYTICTVIMLSSTLLYCLICMCSCCLSWHHERNWYPPTNRKL